MVIDAAVEYLPSPLDVNDGKISAKDIETGETIKEISISNDSSLAALAFKIATDPFV
jgi:elongation factor G